MIRDALASDTNDILDLHRAAFDEEEVAGLVSLLLDDPTAQPLISLVAEDGGRIVGHILVSPARVDGPYPRVALLAPLGVVPDRQGTGVGQALTGEAIARARDEGFAAMFVLGHPTYYPRCGFAPVGPGGPEAPHPIAEKDRDAWMVLELQHGVRDEMAGTLQPAESLLREEYWRE